MGVQGAITENDQSAQVGELVALPKQPINLDASANAPVTPGVAEAVLAALEGGCGNPSSGHQGGERARVILEWARDAIALLVDGVDEDGVVFTSGCTEANNMILAGPTGHGARTLITTSVEHPSVLRPAEAIARRGVAVRYLTVDSAGIMDLGDLRIALAEAVGPVLVSVQAANSETGVLQDLAGIAELTGRRPDALFHSDCAQAFAKARIELGRGAGPDLVTISGHKVNAPPGVGAVLIARDCETELVPLILGGDQEGGMRAGTQAVPAIAGFGAACSEWAKDRSSVCDRMAALRELLEHRISAGVPGARVNGSASGRLPNISSFTFPSLDGMALVAQLDAKGVWVSQGSACSSRRPQPSHVLIAMGMSEIDAFSTIRLSLSRLTTNDEVEEAAEIIVAECRRLRRLA